MVSNLQETVVYPDSNGQPMSDNTKQFRWIVEIKQNLDWLFANDPTVFVAGDLLWYPVEGRPEIRNAPDVIVVFGRPKGDRGSYQQWREDQIPPRVVFEILSPGNTKTEMEKKPLFYDRHQIQEYYIYDPDTNTFSGWQRTEDGLDAIEEIANWTSPHLGIRFDLSGEELQIYYPDGTRFRSFNEINSSLEQERQRAEELEAMLQRYRDRFGDLSE
ncbi:Uma2 family endonuclease [Phormidesmis sp. 146-35]